MVTEAEMLEWFKANPDKTLTDWQAAHPQLAQVNVWPIVTALVRGGKMLRTQVRVKGNLPYTTYRAAP